jgi:mannose-6-phosphate isomerase-like protein (cupin superfamily)
MFIKQKKRKSVEFDKLKIIDYTEGKETASSIAEIIVPRGISHKVSWSKRSDKYYYVVNGLIDFVIGEERSKLSFGDVCVVPKGVKFTYVNNGPTDAKLILVHTPSFNLEYEVFE